MDDKQKKELLEQIREEQHISPFREDQEFIGYIEDGEYDINEYCGAKIDYLEDKKARSLLKNYVLYADYKKLAEFKEKYIGEYDALQRKYYINSHIQ